MISQLSMNAGSILDLVCIQEIILFKRHFEDENIYGQLILLGIMSDQAFYSQWITSTLPWFFR